ncbi:MAG: ribonuclease R [Hyphomicrobiales bacterium]
MNEKTKSPAKRAPLPTREQILAFIAENPGSSGKREIARAFGIKGSDKIALKALLKEIVADGEAERRGKRLRAPGRLPPVTVLEVVGRDRDGEIVATPAEWQEETEGHPPRILILPGRGKDRRPAPGLGDRILARIHEPAEGGQITGRIIKVLARRPNTVLGVYREGEFGARIEPVDRKQAELSVTETIAGVADGDLVVVEIDKANRFVRPKARVTERIANLKSEKAVSLIALHSHGIPYVFPPEVIAEADGAGPVTLADREDWRALPLVTIDPADAKDHDDAVHAAPDTDPENPGGFVVTVAIADVSRYVRPATALDREALKRGNSVYFPDRVVPMLPERISNDLCSLREAEDRPALAARMVFSAEGIKRGHSFHRILMRSAAKFSYQEVQAAIDGQPNDHAAPHLEAVLKPLYAAYAALSKARDARGPLELDLPERKILLKPDGSIDRVIVPERLDAHRLIEEFMIQANVAAAETLEEKGSPVVYRIHDTPSLAKLEALREFLASIDIKLPKTGALRPAQFNRILERVADSEHDALVNEVVLRTQAQAEYSPANIGHFGLNLRRYAHFTSPIRRYADLIVHRALVAALKLGPGGLPAGAEKTLDEVSAQISLAERRAMAAERETIDRLVAHFLVDRIGAIFQGRIAGVTKAGLFVKLADTGADGFVPISTLGEEYFRYDEVAHSVVGETTGTTHRLGDNVEVRLVEAAPVAGALRFELLSEGRAGKPPRGRRRPPKRPPAGRARRPGR